MSVDGIWKVELLGPYGWEAVSTAFLENGRYLSASQDHYTIGKYEVSGNNIKVLAMMHPHGQTHSPPASSDAERTFGFEGEVQDGVISGQADNSESQQSISLRGTWLGELG